MVRTEFWRGRRVLVTGHTGFKGSWLSLWLDKMGANVLGLALEPSTQPNAFVVLKIADRCCHVILDIRDSQRLNSVVHDFNPEVVFHLAAQPLVRQAYSEPMETYSTNVIGTGNLLLSLRDCPSTKAVVVVTTDKCYENQEWHWGYRENDHLGGHDPYSSSKACVEILTASFRKSFFNKGSVGIATARAGNVIGGGDWSVDRLIPDIVKAMENRKTLDIRFPDAIRPWQHVLMPLEGYLMLAERLCEEPQSWSEAFNFAPADSDCVAVSEVLKEFGKVWGAPVPWRHMGGEKLHEARFLKLDASKARSRLHWRPKWNFAQSIRETAYWYRNFLERSNDELIELSLGQIESICSCGDKVSRGTGDLTQ